MTHDILFGDDLDLSMSCDVDLTYPDPFEGSAFVWHALAQETATEAFEEDDNIIKIGGARDLPLFRCENAWDTYKMEFRDVPSDLTDFDQRDVETVFFNHGSYESPDLELRGVMVRYQSDQEGIDEKKVKMKFGIFEDDEEGEDDKDEEEDTDTNTEEKSEIERRIEFEFRNQLESWRLEGDLELFLESNLFELAREQKRVILRRI